MTLVEDEVFALAEVLTVGVGGIESFPEDELVFAVPQAVAAGDGLDVVGAHEILGVATLQTAYAGDVAADAHVVVGDALGSPYAADVVLAFTQDFHLPHFLGVGYGDALAGIGVAIDFDEVAYEADGIAGGGAALQCHALQFLDEVHACGVAQGVGSAKGALADGELMLVEAGVGGVEVGIGVCHFRNGTH